MAIFEVLVQNFLTLLFIFICLLLLKYPLAARIAHLNYGFKIELRLGLLAAVVSLVQFLPICFLIFCESEFMSEVVVFFGFGVVVRGHVELVLKEEFLVAEE